ncbi:helix-turn-helix transcriptional regulator [Loigolactobacillus binensis]|uniref:Helix-turn-helix transcriptional regulator n=1 Tax=Loigolactobacillus binensis TaxID=2559922 RepID=A0ABW3E9J2_9LACO|nr:AraC family transcriptional regulator [Loigolactobacillus binensis]
MTQVNSQLNLMQQFSQLLNFSFCEFTANGQLVTQVQRDMAVTLNLEQVQRQLDLFRTEQPQLFSVNHWRLLILYLPKITNQHWNGFWLCFISLDTPTINHTTRDKDATLKLAATLYLALYHRTTTVKTRLTPKLDALIADYSLRDLLLEELKTNEVTHYRNMNSIYEQEKLFLAAISAGNLKRAESLGDQLLATPEYIGMLSNDPQRRVKEFIIVTVVIVTRAANAGGVPSGESYFKGDKLIRKAEKSVNLENYKSFTQQIITYYTQLVQHYRQKNLPTAVYQVEQYLQQHIYQSLTVEQVAAALQRPAATLSRTIKQSTGLSLKQFILQRKITESRYLLQFSQRSIQEIATLLNFADPSHFTRVFRHYTGQTPSQFRH